MVLKIHKIFNPPDSSEVTKYIEYLTFIQTKKYQNDFMIISDNLQNAAHPFNSLFIHETSIKKIHLNL